MSSPAPREHVLAATHFVLGPSNFLVLRLPPNWDVRIGRNPSDVDYTVSVDGIRWAQEGQATAFLIDEKASRAMEFDLRAARGPLKPPVLEDVQEANVTIGGHPGHATVGGVRMGLLRNKPFQVLHVGYRCEETKRSLSLTFMARCEPAELQKLLPAVAGSRCH